MICTRSRPTIVAVLNFCVTTSSVTCRWWLPRLSRMTTVVAGLHANAEIRPLPFEGGDAPEIKMRALKRIEQLAIRMFQTWGLKIGRDRILRKTGNEVNSTDFDPIPFDSATLPTIPTYTGIKEVSVPGDHAVDTSFALVMDKPWPCTILSLSARVTFDEV